MITTKHIIAVYNLATPSEVEHGMTWYSNALAMLKEMAQDMDSVKVSTYHTMKRKAWHILQEMPTYDQTVTILNGKKIVSFFKNIMGDETEITIDGHARNIYYNDRQGLTTPNTNIRKLEYLDIQKAYQRASKKLGIKAYELQAITWVAWKRIHNI